MDLYEQLRFILNCDIRFVTSSQSQIIEAIDMYYPYEDDLSFVQELDLGSGFTINLLPDVSETTERYLPPQRQELEIETDEELDRFRGLWHSVDAQVEIEP